MKMNYLSTHTGCRAKASVDGHSIKMWVNGRVVREIVDSSVLLGDDVGSLTRRQPGDVQAHTQHQHQHHCQIMGHTDGTGREERRRRVYCEKRTSNYKKKKRE